MLNNEVNYSLICAVREGRLERVRELVNFFGLSYSPGWSEGYTLLCDAIKNERLEVVKFLLEHGAKVKSNNNNVNTPLHFAVSKEYSDIVETLLNRGAYVDAQNKEKQTSLYLAVQKSNETIVRLLLGRGASTYLTDSWGNSLLHIVCSRQSNLNIVELLINHGAYVNCSTLRSCDTPLHLAAREKNEKLVLLLLDRGAHLEATNSSGNTPLHCAVESGSQEVIKLLLDKKANVNAISHNKNTTLHLALQRRDEKNAKLLLEYGANVNIRDKDNKTPLCLAVQGGFSSLIKEILQHNPDVSDKLALKAAVCGYGENYNEIVNSLMKYGITFNHEDVKDSELLHTAVKKGYFKIVECLLNYGADSNSVHNGYTLLYNAIDSSHEEIVNLLLNHGADSNTKCSTYHNTPIHYSIEKKHAGILKSLLANGANTQDKPELLNTAVKRNWSEGCKILLEHGLDVNARDKYDRTAIHYAASGEVAKLLLENGAKLEAKTKSDLIPLHLAVQNGYEEVVSIFLQYENDVNAITENGFTPLHIAVQNRYEKIIDILLNNGANVNAVHENGLVPLHIAVKKGYREIVQTLLEHGANVELNLKGNITPLHIAANSTDEHKEIVECILQHNLDVNLQEDKGNTALHLAALKGNRDIVSMLLKKGSDINIITKQGNTALDLATHGMNRHRNDYYYNDEENYDFDGRGITLHEVYELIAQNIKLHIIKLKAVGLYVSEKNLRAVNYSVDQFENEREEDLRFFSYERELYEFELECRKELKKIKGVRLGTNVSLYDILTTNNPKYTLNKTLVRNLESFNYKEFSVYGSLIESKFKSDKKRIILLESGKKSFGILMKVVIGVMLPILPSEIVEKILSYLENRDLRNLTLCGDNLEGQSNRPNTSLSGVKTSSSIQVKSR